MKNEFDHYIDHYRENNDNALWLSGETSAYFAAYKAEKLAVWYRNLHTQPLAILDFGCGDGIMLNEVHKHFPRAAAYGLDPSAESIAVAKKNFPAFAFDANDGNSTTLNFDNDFFDIIFSAGTFHHIPFTMHHDYITELMRILKPRRSLIIFELNPLNPLTVYTFKKNPIDRNAHMLSPWYTSQMVRTLGFKGATRFICFFPRVVRWLRFCEPLLTKVPFGALYATIIKK